jgi:hypothetical protein
MHSGSLYQPAGLKPLTGGRKAMPDFQPAGLASNSTVHYRASTVRHEMAAHRARRRMFTCRSTCLKLRAIRKKSMTTALVSLTGIESQAFSRLLSIVAYLIGGIMALGAVFGALNAMYSAVSTRKVEIGIDAAVGSSRR